MAAENPPVTKFNFGTYRKFISFKPVWTTRIQRVPEFEVALILIPGGYF
jgi:hypothetical protein